MSKSNIIKRYFLFLAGLFFMGLGIGLITKSNLGTTPISSVAYVLSMLFPLSFGQFNFWLTCFFFLIEVAILRRDFPKDQYFQVLVGLFLGLFIDLAMAIFAFVSPERYVGKISLLFLGCLILAWGIYLQVTAGVIVNPGEGVVKVIADKVGKEFGIIKISFDFALVLIATVISLCAFGTVKGMREGTIISAFLVGYITKIWSGIFKRFCRVVQS